MCCDRKQYFNSLHHYMNYIILTKSASHENQQNFVIVHWTFMWVMGGWIMPIPSKNKSEMICRNLRSVTPPIDYPVENGGFKEIQSSHSSNTISKKGKKTDGKLTNEDEDTNQDQVVLYIDGRRIVKKKKRKCIKCKLIMWWRYYKSRFIGHLTFEPTNLLH